MSTVLYRNTSKPLNITYIVFILLLISPFSGSASWKTGESEHFRVYVQHGIVDSASILQIAEIFYAELPRITRHISDEKIEIKVCDTPKAFQSSVHAPIQDWAVGCAFPLSRRIIIQNPSQITQAKLQVAQVLRHEIAHVLFGQYTQKAGNGVPLWFIEGIAIHLAKEWVPSRHETLLKHVFSKSIIPLQELTKEFPTLHTGAELAYAQSHDALRWFVQVNGIEALWTIIDRLHNGMNLNSAFETVLGYNLNVFDKLWQESLPQRYHWASFLSSSYVFWGGLGGLFIVTYFICWNRRRKQLNQLAEQENTVDPFFRE